MKKLITILFAVALGLNLSAQTDYVDDWNPDADGDNSVGVSDLLALLSVFAENDADNDGIWDSQDDCVGAYDECGGCNGPGPQILGIDTIIVYYDSLYAEAIDEWWVYEVYSDTLLTYLCENPGCMDPTADNYDSYAIEEDNSCVWADGSLVCDYQYTFNFEGHTYDLVAIGDQCWFAENLRTRYYANGDLILTGLSDLEWNSTLYGATAVYGEGTSAVYSGNEDEVSNLADYGRLYNWFAVVDERGLCPIGWHVPTIEEYTQLRDFLGGSSIAGIPMKASPYDNPSWNGTNSSGFSAVAGGKRYTNGHFGSEGDAGRFWSSSETNTFGGWGVAMDTESTWASSPASSKKYGYSVRCLRDAE